MAKIIVTMESTVLQEITLVKDRITIGRCPHNDLVIDDIAISAEHAVIVTTRNDVLLEDLNSTNGTQVNGQPVRQHYLQDHDVIELAKYNLRYIADLPNDRTSGVHAVSRQAAIKVLNGANAGKKIRLNKVLTTIGRPGIQVAAVMRCQPGYCITHVEGTDYPLINGQSIGANAYSITHGDVIDLLGTRMEFLLT
jgi:hypothetical protein